MTGIASSASDRLYFATMLLMGRKFRMKRGGVVVQRKSHCVPFWKQIPIYYYVPKKGVIPKRPSFCTFHDSFSIIMASCTSRRIEVL
jgi:hypothetical protein